MGGAAGCSVACTTKRDYTCDVVSCTVNADVCGDGFVTGSETCDLGSECSSEPGVDCTGNPGVCMAGAGDCVEKNDSHCIFCGKNPDSTCGGCPSRCFDNPPG